MDIYHKLFLVARREHLHQAPVPTHWEPRILDLGCGTGIWAIDMAEYVPNSPSHQRLLTALQPLRERRGAPPVLTLPLAPLTSN